MTTPAPEHRHPTTYGWRAKIGLIVPPTNTVNEAEWNLMAPEGVTIHSTRMPLHTDTSSEAGKRGLYEDIEKSASDLAQAGVDCIAYGCTAGSMVLPVSELSDFIEEKTDTSAVTTAAALVGAMSALGLNKVAVATPYHDLLNEHERAFFESVGFSFVSLSGLGIGAQGPQEYPRIAKTPAADIREHITGADRSDADGMLVSCTDFPVLQMIPELERELGKPVVTSNQATFWAALRVAGIDDQFADYGTLLRDH